MILFGAMAVAGSGKIKASTEAALGFLHKSVGGALRIPSEESSDGEVEVW
ncbi:hypothetical protein HanPSC8_Chr08g0309881 [Helianthus annuus]|nr:hypothetical protein HanPSC8_Chr08g0309881 [Helianthus annuus]